MPESICAMKIYGSLNDDFSTAMVLTTTANSPVTITTDTTSTADYTSVSEESVL